MLKISAVTWGEFRLDENKALPVDHKAHSHELVRAGDLLITRANTTDLVGAVALVLAEDLRGLPRLVLPDKILRLLPKTDVVSPRYLMYALRAPEVRAHFADNATGTSDSMRNLSQPKLAAAPVLLPPLAEQNRIVEKVDALLAQVAAARERLTRVREILKRFRQSVLAAACSGRLTEEWRAAGHPDGEPARASSCNIDSQRDSFAPSFEHRPEDELPLTWRCVPLASLGEWRSGGTPAKGQSRYWSGGTVPWVSPKDMKSSSIGSSQDLVTEAALREARLPRVPPNSLLFVVRGMILAHTFPVGLTTCPVTFNQDIRALTPFDRVNPRYLLLALQHEARHILFAVKEATHGTLRIDADTLRPWPVPLPPRKEQDEIGRRVEELFGVAAAVEERLTTAAVRAQRLPHAVLTKAFRGELAAPEAGGTAAT